MATETKVTSNVTSRTRNTFWWAENLSPDDAAAKKFYSGLFDWTYNDYPMGDTGDVYSIAKRGDCDVSGFMKLDKDKQSKGVPANWLPYILVDDIEATVDHAEQLGGSVMQPVLEIDETGWFAVVVDPTGAAFGLWKAGGFEGADLVNSAGGLTWTELRTSDLAAARTFYGELFGWSLEKPEGMPHEYWMANIDERPTCGLMGLTPDMEGAPSHWSTCFGVADTDSAVSYVKANGGKVVDGPMDTPWGRVAGIIDPQGCALKIMGLTADGGN